MFDLDILVNQLTTSGVCYELKCIKNIFVAKLTNVIYIYLSRIILITCFNISRLFYVLV